MLNYGEGKTLQCSLNKNPKYDFITSLVIKTIDAGLFSPKGTNPSVELNTPKNDNNPAWL